MKFPGGPAVCLTIAASCGGGGDNARTAKPCKLLQAYAVDPSTLLSLKLNRCGDTHVYGTITGSLFDFINEAKGAGLRPYVPASDSRESLTEDRRFFLLEPGTTPGPQHLGTMGPALEVTVTPPEGKSTSQIVFETTETYRHAMIEPGPLLALDPSRLVHARAEEMRRHEVAAKLLESRDPAPKSCRDQPAEVETVRQSPLFGLEMPMTWTEAALAEMSFSTLLREGPATEAAVVPRYFTAVASPQYRVKGTDVIPVVPGKRVVILEDLHVGIVDATTDKLLCRTTIAPNATGVSDKETGITRLQLLQSAELARDRMLGK